MIKRPFNFAVGITCGCFLIVDIAKNADAFTIVIALIATVGNFILAFMERI